MYKKEQLKGALTEMDKQYFSLGRLFLEYTNLIQIRNKKVQFHIVFKSAACALSNSF